MSEGSEQLTSLVGAADHKGVLNILQTYFNNGDNTKIEAVLKALSEVLNAAAGKVKAVFLQLLQEAVFSISRLELITFQGVYYQIVLSFGKCFMAAGDDKNAEKSYLQYLSAPLNVTKSLSLLDRLTASAGLLSCATRLKSWGNAAFAATRGVEPHRKLLLSGDDSSAAKGGLAYFLRELANYHMLRKSFRDASRVLYELYTLQDEGKVLEQAMLCGALSEVSPQRSAQLATLRSAANATQFADLLGVIEKLYQSQHLTPKEEGVLKKNGTGKGVTEEDVTHAVREHNLYVVSRYYVNISLESLSDLLNGTDKTIIVDTLAKMSAQHRLLSKVDEQKGMVYFRTNESVNAMQEWDSRIESICNAITFASDVVIRMHPELASAIV
ncbi:PCI domain containing protein, putative [Angomonas deanei]|uniref:COP9 signalosome complex subunit 4 n=1 Tax=Angomonas deanei TaxID=59799 RepID=A0A7G2C0V6_9TRYP|nr:PCI domain containing protein, putative [Angomonas deanei]